MLITRFNRMIRSKILWGIFAFIIAFAFVGASALSSARRPGGCGSQPSTNVAGMLNGEEVSERELALARFFELGLRSNIPIPKELEDTLHRSAWRRLALLKTARQLGLGASRGEVGQTIRRDPSFAVDGLFHKGAYNTILRDRLGVTPGVFEMYIEQELTLRRAVGVLKDTVWVSPYELRQKLEDFNDMFTVHYALVERDDEEDPPEVRDDDARTFFEENPQLFRYPERVSVRYVTFPTSNYLAQAEVTDEQIDAYYDDHPELHPTNLTNDVVAPIPVEVYDDIREILRRREAGLLAKDAATDFAVALAPGRQAGVPFDLAATRRELNVSTTALFSAQEEAPGLDGGPDFVEAAFELDPEDPAGYFSDAVVGEDAAYILAFGERVPPLDPEFADVADRARALVAREAAGVAFEKRANELRAAVADAMAAEQTFTEGAQAAGLSVATTEQFTVAQGVSSNHEAYAFELLRNVLSMNSGDLSEPIPTTNGVLLVHVVERAPGDIVSLDAQMMRPYLESQISGRFVELLQRGWAQELLRDAGFEELWQPPDGGDGNDDEEG